MECSGSLRFSFPSAKKAREAREAMRSEGHRNGRSVVKISVKGKELVVEISSTDSVALRAAMNGCLRNMKIIENIGGVLE